MSSKVKTRKSRTVDSSEYQEHVPAKTLTHVDKTRWNGLGLDHYLFARDNAGIAAPGVPDYIFGTMLSGAIDAKNRINDSPWKREPLSPGAMTLLDKGHSVNWQWQDKDVSTQQPENVCLFLDSKLVNKVAAQVGETDPRKIEIPSKASIFDPFIHQLTLELKQEAERETPYGKLFGETAAQLLAVHMLRKYAVVKPRSENHIGKPAQKSLKQAIDYIHDNLHLDTSLESLATLANMSSYHFARIFRQCTGLAPHQYVVQCRIEKAKELLKHTNLPIMQISAELGYTNQSHFSKLFKRYSGTTPKMYRSRCK